MRVKEEHHQKVVLKEKLPTNLIQDLSAAGNPFATGKMAMSGKAFPKNRKPDLPKDQTVKLLVKKLQHPHTQIRSA